MISLSFDLRNPWSTRFDNLWCRSFATPFERKFIELEVCKDSNIVSFRFNWTIRQHHAGIALEVGLLGYCLHFNFYDSRHWNYKENRYDNC